MILSQKKLYIRRIMTICTGIICNNLSRQSGHWYRFISVCQLQDIISISLRGYSMHVLSGQNTGKQNKII